MNRLAMPLLRGFMLFVLLSGGLGVMSARGQSSLVYAERFGNGTDCTDPDDPCNFEDALAAVSDYGGVRVRVAEAGAEAVLSGDYDVDKKIYLQAYLRGTDPVEAVVGGVTFTGSVTVGEGGALLPDTDISDGPTDAQGNTLDEAFVILRLAGDFAFSTTEPFGGVQDSGWQDGPIGNDSSGIAGTARVKIGDETGTVVITMSGAACTGDTEMHGFHAIVGDVDVELEGCTRETEMARWSSSGSLYANTLTVEEDAVLDMGRVDILIGGSAPSNLLVRDGDEIREEEDDAVAVLVVEEGAAIEGSGTVTLDPGTGYADDLSSSTETCLRVAGAGALDINVVKINTRSVCLDVSRFGRDSSSNVGITSSQGSVLYVMGDTQINGSFLNRDGGRTEFWGAVEITGNLDVRETTDNCQGADSWRDFGSRNSGVYFFAPATIRGNVDLEGPDNSSMCPGGLQFVGDAEPEMANEMTVPADVSETKVSVIEGDLVMEESALVHLGDFNFYHNLRVEGDITVSSDSEFELALAPAVTGDVDLCTNSLAVTGNEVTLSGDQSMTIRGDVDLDGLAVDKAGSATATISGSMDVLSLKLLSGTLVTNGNLNVGSDDVMGFLAVNHSGTGMTMLSKGSGTMAYGDTAPEMILYEGDANGMSGDEVVSPLERLVVLKSNTTSITLNNSVEITERIELGSGGIVIADADSVVMGANAEAIIGNGTLEGEIVYKTAEGKMDLLYNGTEDRLAGAFFPAVAAPEDAVMGSRVRNVTMDAAGCTEAAPSPVIALNAGFAAFSGDLLINRGGLDVNGQHLVHHVADVGTRKDIVVESAGYLCDSSAGVACGMSSEAARRGELADTVADALALVREADTDVNRRALQESLDALRAFQVTVAKDEDASMIHFVGNGDTEVSVTSGDSRRVDLPRMIVKRQLDMDLDEGTVTLAIANAAVSTATGNGSPNMIDLLGTAGLAVEHGEVVVDMSVDVLDVTGNLVIKSGSLEQESRDAAATGVNEPPQTVRVGMGYMQRGGAFRAEEDGNGAMWMMGDFTQGAELDDEGMDQGATASFDLNGGMHIVMGDFLVGANKENMDSNTYLLGGMCGDMVMDEEAGGLTVMGNYTFNGSGDVFGDMPANEQGLRGRVVFLGSETQAVYHRNDPAAVFCDVHVSGAGLAVMGDVKQNVLGRLTLERGIIDSGGGPFSWMLLNPNVEEDLVGRVTALDNGVATAVVLRGWRRSHVDGAVSRAVRVDNPGRGAVRGGYLFPVGTSLEDGEDAVNAYRPLILQFVEDLGDTGMVTVSHTSGVEVEWPEDGIAVDGDRSGSLLLNAVADMYWRVEFDEVPARNPNLRLAADGLENVFDVRSLRIVQWDCNGMNPRLAGTYNRQKEGIDDESFSVKDFLNGVLNLTQEDVSVGECNYFGVASNLLINPINLDPIEGRGLAGVQFIHNVVNEVVDVYRDNTRILNDWTFQSATGFLPEGGGIEHTIEFVDPEAEDNSDPFLTHKLFTEREKDYVVILHGNVSGASRRVEVADAEDVRQSSAVNNNVDFLIVHGALDLGQVDIRLLNPLDNSTPLPESPLANNMNFGDVSEYITLSQGPGGYGYNFEITTSDNDRQFAVWRLELQRLRNQAFILILSGSGTSSAEGLKIMGVETNGDIFFPSEITATEGPLEVPTEFVLEGNYPNPFNPSTRIQFDLPETAEVTVEVIDILGRTVLTISPQQMEAGSSRTIEVDASELTSGMYLYRLVAVSAAQTHVKSGRMMLVK